MQHLDDFVPADHPLRVIRAMVNKAMCRFSLRAAFDRASDRKRRIAGP